MTLILHVAIPCPLRTIFDYLIIDSKNKPSLGMRVEVSFRNRQLVGIVVGLSEVSSDESITKLKTIDKLIDNKTLIPKSTFDLIHWVSNYYHHPIGECFQTALPKKLRHTDSADLKTEAYWYLNEKKDNISLGKKQQQILAYIDKHPEGISQQHLRKKFESCKSSLLGLEEKKYFVKNRK